VSSIGDDYYFNKKFSLNPFYYLYKSQYKKLVRKVLSHRGSAIYIGDKIRDKYNSEFNLDGETVYLTSEINRREFKPINKGNPLITYCGNIRCGRYRSLLEIATALGQINNEYKLEVYSGERDEKFMKALKKHPNVIYGGSISYADVLKKITASDIIIVAEGFTKEDVYLVKYSLSTKVADALNSGVTVLGYGSIECGAIEYLQDINACEVCCDKDKLKEQISCLIDDVDKQKNYYDIAKEVSIKNHTLESSCMIFERVVNKAIAKGKENV
jgi:hypothetical protein